MKVFMGMETDMIAGPFAVEVRKAVEDALRLHFENQPFANIDLHIRYVPMIMEIDPQHIRKKSPRLSLTKRTIDHNPILDYNIFRSRDWSGSVAEWLNGFMEIKKALSKTSDDPEIPLKFISTILEIKDELRFQTH